MGRGIKKLWPEYKDKVLLKLEKDTSWTRIDPSHNLDSAIDKFVTTDPTDDNTYLWWILQSYVDDGIRLFEDLHSRVKPALTKYQKLLNNKKLKENHREIGLVCGIIGCKKKGMERPGLENILTEYEEFKTRGQIQRSVKEGADLIYEGETIRVIWPHTKEASCLYGRGTKWCIAAEESENMFEDYNKQGPLYIIIPKNPKYEGEKYAVHEFSSNFMDEQDEPVYLNNLLKDYPELKTVKELKFLSDNLLINSVSLGEEVIKEILSTGQGNPAYQNGDGYTALIEVSYKGYAEIVELLLATGQAHPEYQNKDGDTALMFASRGYTEIVKLLLATGQAHPEYQNKNGDTALMGASMFGYTEIVKLLLDTGQTHPEYQNNNGFSALMNASLSNHVNIAKLLIKTGQSHPEYKNTNGETALMFASMFGYTEIVKLLLATGQAHPEYQNKNGDTALMIALDRGRTEVVKLLKKYK